jgi:hypothetical protein
MKFVESEKTFFVDWAATPVSGSSRAKSMSRYDIQFRNTGFLVVDGKIQQLLRMRQTRCRVARISRRFEINGRGGQGGRRFAGQIRARRPGRDAEGGPGHCHLLGPAPPRVVEISVADLSDKGGGRRVGRYEVVGEPFEAAGDVGGLAGVAT